MSEALPADLGQKPDLLWVDIDKIRVDRNYQRDIRANRVAQILRDFTWAHFQPVMLAEQPDGTFTVFDGQHRVAAARAHPLIDQVPAAVVRLEASCEEAGAFLGVNINRTAVSTVEKYHAGIEAGNADMMAVCSVLEEAGCEVIAALGVKPAPNKTTAVTAVQRAIRTYGDAAVTEACRTLVSAWPKDNGALHGVMIQALARLYRNNRDIISRERMTTKLHGKDRRILTADAETIRKIGGRRRRAERIEGAVRGLQQGSADQSDPDRSAAMSDKLLPCPFCGTGPYVSQPMVGAKWWEVSCSNEDCGVMGQSCPDRDAAIAVWNRRTSHTDQRGERVTPTPVDQTALWWAAGQLLRILTMTWRENGIECIPDPQAQIEIAEAQADLERALVGCTSPSQETAMAFLPTEDGEFNGNEQQEPETIAAIVPPHCTGYSFVFEPGALHVRKDGSGYIVVDEDDFVLEDDRCEGEHGPEGSVHWIARMDASEIVALRNFLNGAPTPRPDVALPTVERLADLIDDAAPGILRPDTRIRIASHLHNAIAAMEADQS